MLGGYQLGIRQTLTGRYLTVRTHWWTELLTQVDDDRAELLNGLFASVSDETLTVLQHALLTASKSGSAASTVAAHAIQERAQRDARDAVFAPILPLCRPGANAAGGARLPFDPTLELWRLLCRAEPQLVSTMQKAHADPEQTAEVICAANALTSKAADWLESDERCASLRNRLEAGSPGASAKFVALVRLSPVVRAILPGAKRIVRAPSADDLTALRLRVRDAVSDDSEALPVLISALGAHLDRPIHVLQIVSAIMGKPSAQYLASSELAGIGSTVLEEVGTAIVSLRSFPGCDAPDGGVRAAKMVAEVARDLAEFGHLVDLRVRNPWGDMILRQRRELADVVSRLLADAVTYTALAVRPPKESLTQVQGPVSKAHSPNDTTDNAGSRVPGLLAFLDRVRSSAHFGGFGVAHAAAMREIQSILNASADDATTALFASLDVAEAGLIREQLSLLRRYGTLAGLPVSLTGQRAAA